MNKKSFALLAALTAGSCCLSTVITGGTASAAPLGSVGMPNPMKAYDSVAEAKAAAGFQPLYLPSMTGYHVSHVWVIAGDTIDIEYTADVVWGLQLEALHDKLFDSQGKINEKRRKVKEAKAANPRRIELVCLKNRFGISSYSCMFDYYPQFDFFRPIMEGIDMTLLDVDQDGFIAIPDGFNFDLPFD